MHVLTADKYSSMLELMTNISINRDRLPSNEDFLGTVAAVNRLLRTYQLPVSRFASGHVGQFPSLHMSGT